MKEIYVTELNVCLSLVLLVVVLCLSLVLLVVVRIAAEVYQP